METQKILWFTTIFLCLQYSVQYEKEITSVDPIEQYCSSLISCKDCKKASPQCDWCHEIGCTHLPTLHCPQKLLLDRTYKKDNYENFCSEIDSTDPIFVPANLRKFIKMNLRIDDMTLYKRNILCEIHIEDTILRVKATLSESVLYCNMTILRVNRSVSLGYIRLLWGGAEPYSNMVLIIVYACEYMASDCMDCQVLDKGFNCGWCSDTASCSLIEECPRHYGPWINKKSLCGKIKAQKFYSDALMKPFLRFE